jgi:signal transduction histidine kinase
LVARLGLEVDEAIEELRTVAQGAPDALVARGLGWALRSASEWTAIPVRIFDEGVRRHAPAVEASVYFCCLEALQNAAKHGGPGVRATVVLAEAAQELRFTVQDDGRGFDTGGVRRGAGLSNLADRVAAVGGSMRIDSEAGRGTRIAGRVPV